MKLSTNSRYGLRSLIDLAEQDGGAPVTLNAIANRQAVSESYLEQAFSALKKAGLVRSTRGSSGGYTLTRSPEQIRVGDVLRVLEGDLNIMQGNVAADAVSLAIADLVWQAIDSRLQAVVDDTTLADLIREHERMRGRAQENDGV